MSISASIARSLSTLRAASDHIPLVCCGRGRRLAQRALCTTLLARDLEAFALFKNLLPLTSFTGAPYSLDETGVVKCVFKARCSASTLAQVTNKLNVNLSHVDRGAHEATGDHDVVGRDKWDVRCQLEVPSLEAVGVITGEAEPCL